MLGEGTVPPPGAGLAAGDHDGEVTVPSPEGWGRGDRTSPSLPWPQDGFTGSPAIGAVPAAAGASTGVCIQHPSSPLPEVPGRPMPSCQVPPTAILWLARPPAPCRGGPVRPSCAHVHPPHDAAQARGCSHAALALGWAVGPAAVGCQRPAPPHHAAAAGTFIGGGQRGAGGRGLLCSQPPPQGHVEGSSHLHGPCPTADPTPRASRSPRLPSEPPARWRVTPPRGAGWAVGLGQGCGGRSEDWRGTEGPRAGRT